MWIRTHRNATCRWHVASTSANTGRYNNFLSLVKENAYRIHHPLSPATHYLPLFYMLPDNRFTNHPVCDILNAEAGVTMVKKIRAIILILFMLAICAGCARVNMPFNGDIQFHNISLTVPQRFIRDSTQSTNDLWVFEHSFYSECILISRKDVTGDIPSAL